MDNLYLQKITENDNNNNAIENHLVTNGDCKQKLIINSGKDSQKNGGSKGLLEESPSDERDNVKLKNAFNIENTNFNQVNTSNTLHKNEIDLIAYNSGNMGEVRPKRCNKNNVCM
jgi:3-oxoacyl-[acyl-carrier-protein] synthase III